LHRARPAGRFVGGNHWEAPDALWPANGQNQEGARELRAAAVKRPHTRAAYAWAHEGLAWDGGRRSRAWAARVVYRPDPGARGAGGPRDVGSTRGLGTTLRTSSASVIASPLSPVHLAAVATDCRENVEAARMLAQLLRHPRLTVGGLPQCPVGSGSCGNQRRPLILRGGQTEWATTLQERPWKSARHSARKWILPGAAV
jgi:hypothetical protein